MPRTAAPPRRRWALPLAAAGGLVAALLIIVAAVGARPASGPPPAAPAPAPHFVDTAAAGGPRTLVVAAKGERLPGTSNAAGFLMSEVLQGQIPQGAAEAVVLTDENCAPDADGISHCRNQLQIGSAVVTVAHHHDMQRVPCLTPGEKVRLMSLADYEAGS